MRYISFIVLLFLISNISAFTVDIQTIDINNKQNIPNVLIKIYNPTGNILNSSSTNTNGLASLSINETLLNYTYTYNVLGYHIENDLVKNDTLIIYKAMYPISDDGLIQLNFGDKIFNTDREFCIYYRSNNRLDGCYRLNDTISLLVNQEYIIIPKTTFTDSLTSFKNIKNNFSSNAFLLIMIISITVFTLAIFNYYFKRGLKAPKIFKHFKRKKNRW